MPSTTQKPTENGSSYVHHYHPKSPFASPALSRSTRTIKHPFLLRTYLKSQYRNSVSRFKEDWEGIASPFHISRKCISDKNFRQLKASQILCILVHVKSRFLKLVVIQISFFYIKMVAYFRSHKSPGKLTLFMINVIALELGGGHNG